MNTIARILIVLLVLFSPHVAEAKKSHDQGNAPAQRNVPGKFDYYVLSLSWSPDYCSGNAQDTQQCGPTKRFGFVPHGLWPQ
ncbi:Ribonuclease [Paraburkholderia ultramafica]|uniref:Ribonuclease n=1 Tax=Paraburkholderia ultramafica TaxID=1544867 RepID=A0A6S7AV16_9BURK|nr:hypothetical protein [Paraburkholderia ultramafica]CAB3778800.1 Ribonuclease [Paraburkholderia ultramafica]